MRQERTVQASLFDRFADHEICCELKAMLSAGWMSIAKLLGLAAEDLRRHGVKETGREGLPAELVFCAARFSSSTARLSLSQSWRFILRTRHPLEPSPDCHCRGRRRNRCCIGPSSPSGPRPGRRSIALCSPARVRIKLRPARWCGSTALSSSHSCTSQATAAFSGMRCACWCGC